MREHSKRKKRLHYCIDDRATMELESLSALYSLPWRWSIPPRCRFSGKISSFSTDLKRRGDDEPYNNTYSGASDESDLLEVVKKPLTTLDKEHAENDESGTILFPL
jgi:hypothetical protein